MKRIEALIRHHKLLEVKDSLTACGVEEITVSVVRGYGRQHGHREWYRGAEYTVDFVSKARLEVLVSDTLAGEVIETILKTARTGTAGDGMILVYSFADAIPVCVDDGSCVEDASASLPPDEHADVPEESVLSQKRVSAAAIITILMKLLGPACARWHDLFR